MRWSRSCESARTEEEERRCRLFTTLPTSTFNYRSVHSVNRHKFFHSVVPCQSGLFYPVPRKWGSFQSIGPRSRERRTEARGWHTPQSNTTMRIDIHIPIPLLQKQDVFFRYSRWSLLCSSNPKDSVLRDHIIHLLVFKMTRTRVYLRQLNKNFQLCAFWIRRLSNVSFWWWI